MKPNRWNRGVCCAVVLAAGLGTGRVDAAEGTSGAVQTGTKPDKATRVAAERLIDRAVRFLKTTARADDGSYSREKGPGVTALVVVGLLRCERFGPDDPFIRDSLKVLESFVKPDGGIYDKYLRNYNTAIGVMALAEANRDGRYDQTIRRAQAFLKGLQWGVGPKAAPSNPAYGGGGYGRHRRPDLSNTQIMLDGLRASGLSPDDPAWQRALVFISRCQNLKSEYNDQAWAGLVNDGGFIYTPVGGGESKGGRTANGGLRSYGSMTYAGLKSYVYAGLTAADPRVKSALGWIRNHYTLDRNPGLGVQGLYYYYHTLAKTLFVLGLDEIVDARGVRHDWRAELVAKLADHQQKDGSWINRAHRWYEDDPALVTGYSLMALAYCRKAARK